MIDVQDRGMVWQVEYLAEGGAAYKVHWTQRYEAFEDIPKLTQTAVALLTLCDANEAIKGVGRRVSEGRFWVESTPEVLSEYPT